MDKLIDTVPKILEQSGSLFGFFALMVLVIAFLSYVFYLKAEKADRNRAFILILLFFFGLVIAALAAGVFSGFQRGSEATTVTVSQNPGLVNPSLVKLSPDSTRKLEDYIKSKGAELTEDNKTRILEEALGKYTNPQLPPKTSVDPPPPPSETTQMVADGTQKVRWKYKSCVRKSANVSCAFELTTTEERVNYGLRLNNGTKMTGLQGGREYFVSKATFVDTDGNKDTDLYREMQKGIPYNVSVDFASIPPSETKANLIVTIAWYGTQIKFDNISIQ